MKNSHRMIAVFATLLFSNIGFCGESSEAEAEQQKHQTEEKIERPAAVYMTAPINTLSTVSLMESILNAIVNGATSIDLHISSTGGNLEAGFAAYGFLKSLPVPLRTHNIGNVESIAIILYLAGSERTAAEHARFVIHSFSWSENHVGSHTNRIIEVQNSLIVDEKRYTSIFELETKGAKNPIDPSKYFRNQGIYIDAIDARSAGITTMDVSAEERATPQYYRYWVIDKF